MKDQLVKLYFLCLGAILVIFLVSKFIYKDMHNSIFWDLYIEKMAESLEMGAIFL